MDAEQSDSEGEEGEEESDFAPRCWPGRSCRSPSVAIELLFQAVGTAASSLLHAAHAALA